MAPYVPRAALLGLSVSLLALAACTIPDDAAAPATVAPSPSPTAAAPSSARTPSAGPSSPGTPGPAAEGGREPASSCTDLVGRLSLAERVGQLLMVGVSSTALDAAQASVIGRTHAGSVLLLGNATGGLSQTRQVVADVRSAADRPQRVNVILAADQEGGLVQRLSGSGFSDIPSAARQAELSDATLTDDAEIWGDQLDKAGINVNLAPVADVVPRDLAAVNEPIAKLRRGYGPSPATVAAKVTAFTDGMNNAGIATAVKHFPGLGRVRGNTDLEQRVVDTTTTRRDPALQGFSAAVDAGVDMVMVSSAFYARIDPKRQAVFSAAVVTEMIRGDLAFDGVVISDDLSAAAVSEFTSSQRAVGFLRAGGDLIIVGDPAQAEEMAAALVQRAGTDVDFAQRIDQSAARVLALKARRGLARC